MTSALTPESRRKEADWTDDDADAVVAVDSGNQWQWEGGLQILHCVAGSIGAF